MTVKTLPELHILVIDDEPFMLKLIERTLKGIRVGKISTTENGAAAIEYLLGKIVTIDLIICDLEMPEMNGLQFIERVRSGKTAAPPDIPIMVLTGNAEENTVAAAGRLGIGGYLVKPISHKNLGQKIAMALTHPVSTAATVNENLKEA